MLDVCILEPSGTNQYQASGLMSQNPQERVQESALLPFIHGTVLGFS